jgi:hypothetical protein
MFRFNCYNTCFLAGLIAIYVRKYWRLPTRALTAGVDAFSKEAPMTSDHGPLIISDRPRPCQVATALFRVEPVEPGYDKRPFKWADSAPIYRQGGNSISRMRNGTYVQHGLPSAGAGASKQPRDACRAAAHLACRWPPSRLRSRGMPKMLQRLTPKQADCLEHALPLS